VLLGAYAARETQRDKKQTANWVSNLYELRATALLKLDRWPELF
jgi:hypothetical protein